MRLLFAENQPQLRRQYLQVAQGALGFALTVQGVLQVHRQGGIAGAGEAIEQRFGKAGQVGLVPIGDRQEGNRVAGAGRRHERGAAECLCHRNSRIRVDADDLGGVGREQQQQEEHGHHGLAQALAVGVHLAQRAHPLLQMMEWTDKEAGFILWETDKDF